MRVLLVDDDKDVLDAVGSVLEREGIEVVRDESAERAYERIEREHFDWLVTDGYMTDESGFELAGRMRQTHPQTKRVLLSGVYTDSPVSKSLFQRVFRKPVDPVQLAAYLKTGTAV